MPNLPISGLPDGTPSDANLLPQSTGSGGQTQKVTYQQVSDYISGKLIDVSNGQVAVGLGDGTIAGFAQFTYSAGDQKVNVNHLRLNTLTTPGFLQNDATGNVTSTRLGYYHEISDGLSYNETLPMHTVINVTNAGGGLSITLPDMTSPLAFQANKSPPFYYFNNGNQTVLILDNAANTVLTIHPDEGYQGIVTSNATASGSFVFERIKLAPASASQDGYLSSSDWTTFNNKQIGLNLQNVGTNSNATGMSLVGPNFNLEQASDSFPGVVSTGTQSFGGNKTFTGTIDASNLSGTNRGDPSFSNVTNTSNATGFAITPGNTSTPMNIALTEANGSFPGVLSAGTQTIGGEKTFTGNVILNNSNQIGMGTATPDPSALLDLNSTTRGFKLPVMTATQKNNITSPAIGLMVYESSTLVPWVNILISGWTPFILGNISLNQIMYSSGTGIAQGSSALTVSSGTVVNTTAGGAFRGTGSNSYIGIGANSSGTNGSIFAEANTAGNFFTNTASGNTVLRNSSTSQQIKIGIGSGNSQLNITNDIVYTNVTLGVGTGAPATGVPLGFASNFAARKISFSSRGNDNQDEAIGTTSSSMLYQVRDSTFSHVFRYGTSSSTSNEIMRIMGTGQVGIATSSPNASAIFQIDSTTQGALVPRMTSAQRNAISSPADGLEVYDTDIKKKCFYASGTGWQQVTTSAAP